MGQKTPKNPSAYGGKKLRLGTCQRKLNKMCMWVEGWVRKLPCTVWIPKSTVIDNMIKDKQNNHSWNTNRYTFMWIGNRTQTNRQTKD